MKKLATMLMALGLVVGACKKEEKDGGGEKAGKKQESKEKQKEGGEGGDPKKAEAAKLDDKKVDPPVVEDKKVEDQAARPAPSGDGWRMELKAPQVGLKITQETVGTAQMVLEANGQKIPMDMSEQATEHAEIVEVANGVVTKVKVHYAVDSETRTVGGQAEKEESPVHGKAYVVWDDGGKLAATRDDGSKVSDEEMEQLQDNWGDEVGRMPGEARVIAGRAWTKGERYVLTADDLKIIAEGKSEKGKMREGAITFHGEEGGIATFEVEAAMEIKDMKVEIDADAKIMIKLDVANSRPIELTTSAKMKGKVMSPQGTIPLEGAGGDTKTYTYQ